LDFGFPGNKSLFEKSEFSLIINSKYSMQDKPTFIDRSTHPTMNARQDHENILSFEIRFFSLQ